MQRSAVALFVVAVACAGSCRIFGIVAGEPCATDADCDPASLSLCGPDGTCVQAAEGEGEDGEGEGAEGEGDAAGEGEGDAGEGEGDAAEGEGEGEGDAGAEGEGEGDAGGEGEGEEGEGEGEAAGEGEGEGEGEPLPVGDPRNLGLETTSPATVCAFVGKSVYVKPIAAGTAQCEMRMVNLGAHPIAVTGLRIEGSGFVVETDSAVLQQDDDLAFTLRATPNGSVQQATLVIDGAHALRLGAVVDPLVGGASISVHVDRGCNGFPDADSRLSFATCRVWVVNNGAASANIDLTISDAGNYDVSEWFTPLPLGSGELFARNVYALRGAQATLPAAVFGFSNGAPPVQVPLAATFVTGRVDVVAAGKCSLNGGTGICNGVDGPRSGTTFFVRVRNGPLPLRFVLDQVAQAGNTTLAIDDNVPFFLDSNETRDVPIRAVAGGAGGWRTDLFGVDEGGTLFQAIVTGTAN